MYFTRLDEQVVNTQLIDTSAGMLCVLHTNNNRPLIDLTIGIILAGYSATTVPNETTFRGVTEPLYEVTTKDGGKQRGFSREAWIQWLNTKTARIAINERKKLLLDEMGRVWAEVEAETERLWLDNAFQETDASVSPLASVPVGGVEPVPCKTETDLVVPGSLHGTSCAVTTSLKVAEVFGKNHNHVLRDIENLLATCSEKFAQSNFGLISFPDSYGRKQPVYEMTRDGFMLLAMGFTGAKAMRFKEAFIEAFNLMEEQLATRTPQDYISALKALIVQEEEKQRLQAQNAALKTDNKALEHRAKKAENEVEKLEVEKAENAKYTDFGKDFEESCQDIDMSFHCACIRELNKNELSAFGRNKLLEHLRGEKPVALAQFDWYGRWVERCEFYNHDKRAKHTGHRLTREGFATGWFCENQKRSLSKYGTTIVHHSVLVTPQGNFALMDKMREWLISRGLYCKATRTSELRLLITETIRRERNKGGDLMGLMEEDDDYDI